MLPAKILALIEQNLIGGESIANYVDMICGTSTGGIIGLGLGLEIDAPKILRLYEDHGAEIFPKTWRKGVLSAKHAREPLDAHLADTFGDALLGDCKSRMVIPSFDHLIEPSIFKTDHHPDYKRDWEHRAAHIAASTSAAPVYLGAHFNADRIQWDGGLFANHPLMNGLVDALACYDLARTNVRVLSIGCGKALGKVEREPEKMADAGFADWAFQIAPTASALQLHDSLGQAGLLIGRHNITRINPELSVSIDLDDTKVAKSLLPELAEQEFKAYREELDDFFSAKTHQREKHYSS